MNHHIKNREELNAFMHKYIVTPGEATEMLGITRQRLTKLVNDGRLIPVKQFGKTTVYYKPDLEVLKKELELGREKYRPYDQ
ncbi:type IV toxin-antitoxin system AbiEi family antitoxin domain-containing protein [Geomicrobium sediminis]|uniref:DNA-binding protein n=1 Tax=Geomicrobium sediminis TaxID=1347788 RepID=A0ABS2PFQ5_9BACL|nr:type IV toxin-antitoxin system AbiEi family antitoxin domain-containing protein [Geomicrobium sediminis]MBM7634097.1 hypothetical protein [Geomicrobium sediminis]